MKFYNPFRWHVCRHGDKFIARRYKFPLGWTYLETPQRGYECMYDAGGTWYYELQWCANSLEVVQSTIKEFYQSKNLPKIKFFSKG